MGVLSLLAGALTLRNETFIRLRERSDVFYRGFLVLLLVGLLAGAFQAAFNLFTRVGRSENADQIAAEVMQGLDQSGAVQPGFRSMIEDYVREGVGIAVDINRLTPQAGASYRPIAYVLEWVGATLATPFSGGFAGYLLALALLVHLASRWLGGRASMAQMLGLGALALAPHVLDPLSSLCVYLQQVTHSGIFGTLNGLLGLVVSIWGLVILVKATSVAQGFDLGRAIGAVVLALVMAILAVVVLGVLAGAAVALMIAMLAR